MLVPECMPGEVDLGDATEVRRGRRRSKTGSAVRTSVKCEICGGAHAITKCQYVRIIKQHTAQGDHTGEPRACGPCRGTGHTRAANALRSGRPDRSSATDGVWHYDRVVGTCVDCRISSGGSWEDPCFISLALS
jgi:hypothetical protein